jgi:hypothetical protein
MGHVAQNRRDAKDPAWCWVVRWRYGRSKSAVSGGLWNTYSYPRRVREVWQSWPSTWAVTRRMAFGLSTRAVGEVVYLCWRWGFGEDVGMGILVANGLFDRCSKWAADGCYRFYTMLIQFSVKYTSSSWMVPPCHFYEPKPRSFEH